MTDYVKRFQVRNDTDTQVMAYIRDATLGDTVDKLAKLDVRPFLSTMMEGSSALFVGDSYTYGTGASDHGSTDYKRWSTIVSLALNLAEINVAVGSTGFVDPGSGGQNSPFLAQYNNWYNNATTGVKDSVKAVFIAGGFNDVFYDDATYSSTQTAARNLLNRVISTLPNAAIIYIPMMWRGYGFTVKARNLYNTLVRAAQTCTRPDRVTCIRNAFTWTAYTTDIYSDGIHPNDSGHAHIAQGVLQGINDPSGASSDTWNTWDYNDYVTSGPSNMVERKGDMVSTLELILTFSTTLEANSNITVANLAPNLLPRYNVYTPIYRSNAIVGTAGIVGSEAASGTPGSLHIITGDTAIPSCFIPSLSWPWFGARS